MDKSILDIVHGNAKDWHATGVMKETTLREFDALCLPPVNEYLAVQIKRIRTRVKASQCAKRPNDPSKAA
ncbi:hypothetical protein [Marinagarivorans algicola]|uniref:hypothetical protein n=1 Tax=Marinagarivorans algicola TaxID=1513270 RepID=UPI000B1A0AC6|nr:hypothetical protein [Marinagarivorans algicola]